ncbi:AAA family ATPase [Vibrio sp. Makdt]|uniref:ParA family protein n=1 Tax=Vibrio sp. Makdt TaxID=2998828 RepID=UPI0022CD42DE|nr:AAA family ATPase [Vibrio sp. Makdt]MDA0152450.1 AAA family ATPase [Vibrio sp. Makdt]
MNGQQTLSEGRQCLRLASQNIVNNQISLRAYIHERVNTYNSGKDNQVQVDPLVYAHSHATTDVKELLHDKLSREEKRNFAAYIKKCEDSNIIDRRIETGRAKRVTFDSVIKLRKLFGFSSWGDDHDSMVVGVQNQKGGTGKTTTGTTYAVGIAGNIDVDAKVALLDLDPQGSGGVTTMDQKGLSDEDTIVTLVDILLYKLEANNHKGVDYLGNESNDLRVNQVSQMVELGLTIEDIIEGSLMNSHLSSLKVLPSFPTDNRFSEIFYHLDIEQRLELARFFTNVVIPTLKKHFDFIIFDVAPSDVPINWLSIDAVEFLITPFTPNYFDYISTRDFLVTTDKRLDGLYSKGKNLLSFMVLPVNVDDSDKTQRSVITKAAKDFGLAMSSKRIYRNKLFTEAASKECTIYDLRPLSDADTTTQTGEKALSNMNEVIGDFLNRVSQLKSKRAA